MRKTGCARRRPTRPIRPILAHPALAHDWTIGATRQPTQIDQVGNSLLFTNEFGDKSRGTFDSPSVVDVVMDQAFASFGA